METLNGRDGDAKSFAPLRLWSIVLHGPRALPWAVTYCAFGTEQVFVAEQRLLCAMTQSKTAATHAANDMEDRKSVV